MSYWYEITFLGSDAIVIVRLETKEETKELMRTAGNDWIIKKIEPQKELLNG